jgi:excisionase family DNA binding protein
MTGEILLYSPQEAAEMLGVSRSQMFELLACGDVESVKIGRLRKIPREALTAYVARLRQQAIPA